MNARNSGLFFFIISFFWAIHKDFNLHSSARFRAEKTMVHFLFNISIPFAPEKKPKTYVENESFHRLGELHETE